MAVDFSRYQAPGVYAESIPGPLLSVQSPTPMALGIFGLTVGFRTDSEAVRIPVDLLPEGEEEPLATKTQALRQPGIKKSTVRVNDPSSGREFIDGTDYTVEISSGSEGGRDARYSIKRIQGGHLLEGDDIQVSYSYTNDNHFEPHTFFDYTDVQSFYGRPFTQDGEIQSELSLAARIAFMNGAQQIVCVAVDPENTSAPALSEYEDALQKLEGHMDISIVVPATGMRQIQDSVTSHVRVQSNNNYERRAIVGRDGSETPVPPQQLISDAETIRERRVMLVGPASLKFFSSDLNREIAIGGQFLAAAVAGVAAALAPAEPITRKPVTGFIGSSNEESDGQKNRMAQSGVAVVEKSRNSTFRMRHGVTTDPSTVLTREWSIIGQQDRMVQQMKGYLDADGLVGTMINDLTLVNIKASAEAALQSLTRDNSIRDYRDLKVRQVESSPDVVEVSFEWRASLPLNYILVRFALNTSTGDVFGGTTPDQSV